MRIDDNGNLTSETFDAIVRGEINRQFYEKYLTDQRTEHLFERIPQKELKEEAYSIFFRSFDNILEGIGIPRDKKMKLDYSWYNYDNHKIEWCDIVHTERKGWKKEKDIHIPFKWYMISFSYKRIKYRISVTGRINRIVRYLITKGIHEPLFEASKGMKRKTLEERQRTLADGTPVVEWDLYNYVKLLGTETARELKYLERAIWHPDIERHPGDKERERMIGDFG
jgi:hypothetical protein